MVEPRDTSCSQYLHFARRGFEPSPKCNQIPEEILPFELDWLPLDEIEVSLSHILESEVSRELGVIGSLEKLAASIDVSSNRFRLGTTY